MNNLTFCVSHAEKIAEIESEVGKEKGATR